MKIIKKYIIILLVFICEFSCMAQSLYVKEFFQTNEVMSVKFQKRDLNRNVCALIKVQLPIAGVKFEGNIIAQIYDINEYLVYLSPGSKKMTVKCPKQRPLIIEFKNYSEIGCLKAKTIYRLDLDYEVLSESEQVNESLKYEYYDIVSQANKCFNSKDFEKAKNLYNEAIDPKFNAFYDVQSFAWVNLCDSILKAQSEFKAVTPKLADAFYGMLEYLDYPCGFSEDVMVVKRSFDIIFYIIGKNGSRYKLTEAFSHALPFFSNGFLPVLPITFNGANCFIYSDGSIALNYKTSRNNELFKNPNLRFEGFKNNFSVVENWSKSEKGLINRYGNTIINPTKKYKEIVILDNYIILSNSKKVYIAEIYSNSFASFDKTIAIRYSLKYNGFLIHVTDDYLLFMNPPFTEGTIYPLIGSQSYKIKCNHIYPVNEEKVLIDDGAELFIYDYKTGRRKNLFPLNGYSVISEGTIFDGKYCYDFDGNLLFTLPEKVKFSKYGFIDGYMLVESNRFFRYIDKEGKTLKGSGFIVNDKQTSSHLLSYAAKPFSNGFGLIIKDGLWGLIDKFGTTTFDYQKK